MDKNQTQYTQPMMDGQPTGVGGPPPAPIPAPNQYPVPQPIPQPQPVPQAQPMPQAQPVQHVQPSLNVSPHATQQVVHTEHVHVNPNTMNGGRGVAPKPNPAMFRGVTESIFCECPSCGQATHTRVEVENSAMQWILCLIMFIVGLWLCCFIPFCVDSLRVGNHYCSN